MKKASKTHAGQAKTLQGMIKNGKSKNKKVNQKVNQAGNYTKPGLRKRIFNRIKAQASHGTGARDNGVRVKRKQWPRPIKKLEEDTNNARICNENTCCQKE